MVLAMTEKATAMDAIWDAAKRLDTDISGLSWNGFNVAGDRKSIDEVCRLMHCESRLQWFEKHQQECRK
jgi:hypothetical protein